jgi:hypothetical protein
MVESRSQVSKEFDRDIILKDILRVSGLDKVDLVDLPRWPFDITGNVERETLERFSPPDVISSKWIAELVLLNLSALVTDEAIPELVMDRWTLMHVKD